MTQTNVTTGNTAENDAIYKMAKSEFKIWQIQGLITQADMEAMTQCISPDYSENLDDPQIDKKRGLVDLYLKLESEEIDLDAFSSQAIDLWNDQITDTSKLTDDNSTGEGLSEADKTLIDVLGKAICEIKLADLTDNVNPRDTLEEVLYSLKTILGHTLNLTNVDRHILNIQVVFANYMAGGQDSESKTEKLETQIWLMKMLMLFQRNLLKISDLQCTLQKVLDKIEAYDAYNDDLSNN